MGLCRESLTPYTDSQHYLTNVRRMAMSTSGVHLKSSASSLTNFSFTVREYLQELAQALMSQNLPSASQELNQIANSLRTLAKASGWEPSEQVLSSLRGIQTALASGDFVAAGQSLNQLSQQISLPSTGASSVETNPAQQVQIENDAPSGGSFELNQSLSVRV